MEARFARTSRKFVLGTTLAVALGLTAVPGMAQSGYDSGNNTGQEATQQQYQQGMQQSQKQNFDQQTLEKFAAAAVDLGRIQDNFAQELRDIQDHEKAMELQSKINQKMVKAVQSQGLEVQTYTSIANQMSSDAQLKQRVEKLIAEQN